MHSLSISNAAFWLEMRCKESCDLDTQFPLSDYKVYKIMGIDFIWKSIPAHWIKLALHYCKKWSIAIYK